MNELPHPIRRFDRMHPAQKAALKAMTAEQKLKVGAGMWHTARSFKSSSLRRQHPDWSEERIADEVRTWLMHAPD